MSDLLRPEAERPWQERIALLAPALSARGPAGLIALCAAGLAGVLALAAVGWWLFRSPPPPVELALPSAVPVTTVAPPGPAPAPASPGASDGPPVASPGARPADVVAQAAGAVVRPGVYRLPAGARVADLLAVAGGPTADADAEQLALAALLVDGQRVHVPRVGEVPSPGIAPSAPAGPAAPSGPLDLNTATVTQLDELPGVGPATATAIVARRDEHGPFRSVDELLDVPGIGPAKLEALRDLVRV